MPSTTTAKPRILLLSTAYLPLIGGSELAIHHIAQQLTDYDFDLVTGRLSPDQPFSEQIGRVRVFRAGGRLSGLTVTHPKFFLPFAMALTAWRLTRTRRHALMHAYQASQAAGAALIVHMVRPSIPFIVTLQEGKALDHQSWPVRWARALILHSADHITAISGHLASYARRFSRAPVSIIPNGVTIHEISRAANPDPTILTVSRLVRKNNVEGTIRAFSMLQKTITNARLAIVGDGPLRDTLERLASTLGVRGAVDFRGSIPHDELAVMYGASDVFVRPSLSEGLGSVFLEAMAARVPVVASAVGGITDIVRNEETGLICNPQNPADIAHAIGRLLTDTPLRERLIAEAYRFVQNYDWPVIAGKMAVVYRSLISQPTVHA